MSSGFAVLPGDVLLFRPVGLLGWIAAFKQSQKIGHAELYAGAHVFFAARQQGVQDYRTIWPKLAFVLRPKPETPFSLAAARRAFYDDYLGQSFDVLGLLRFGWVEPFIPEQADHAQFCSELVTRLLRAGGFDPFNALPAGDVPPWLFLACDGFSVTNVEGQEVVWG